MGQPILQLSNTSQLIENLPLTTVTVLLFTALWSAESEHARQSLRNATDLKPCQESIQLYEISLPMPASPRKQRSLSKALSKHFVPSFFNLNALLADSPHVDQEAARLNITSRIPWLPCIQLFSNTSQFVEPVIHTDSFDQYSIATSLRHFCESLSKPTLSVVPNVPNVLISPHPLPIDTDQWHDSRWHGITPVSRDRFAQLLTASQATPRFGMLVCLQGGLTVLRTQHADAWNVITTAINSTNSLSENSISRPRSGSATYPGPWVVSVVDNLIDIDLARRLHLKNSDSVVSLLLVNTKAEYTRLVEHNHETSLGTLITIFRNFRENKVLPSGTPVARHADMSKQHYVERAERILSYYNEPGEWKHHFAPLQCRVSLRDWLDGRFHRAQRGESITWLVVYQPWCAFCQRVLPIYRHFATLVQRAGVDVHVVMIQGCQGLDHWIHELVDGFPTVVLLRRSGFWNSAVEFLAPHSLNDFFQNMDFLTERLLREETLRCTLNSGFLKWI